jgi:RHS repeat-associated protein
MNFHDEPSIQNPFLFSTKYFDAESSLYYYGYRYYQPSSGRWLSRDPIEEIGGGNPYAFLSNEPIGQVDFTGLLEVSDTRLHHPIQEWFVKYTDIGRRSYGLRIRLSIDMHVNIDDELTKIRLAYRNGKLSDVQVWNRMVLAHLRIFGPLFRDWWRISRDLGFRSSITFSGGGAAVVATLGGKKVILSKLSTAGGAVIIAGGAVLIYQIQTTKWELQAYAAEIEAENDHFNAVLGAMDRISKRHSDLVTTEVLKKIDCPNRERANDCFSLFARRVKINYVMWEQVKHSIPHVMDIEAREAILEGRFKELMQCLSEQGCCWKP